MDLVLRGTSKKDVLVGVGTPGSISLETGLLRNSNTQCLNNRPLKKMIQSCLGMEVSIANDANCFALAEAVLGAGKNEKIVFGVILGTGCGGGLVINKKCIKGPNSIAGEFGHHSIDQNGRPCWCGKQGCLETYISGSGLEARFFNETGKRMSAKEIFSSNSNQARVLKLEYMKSFGFGIANLCSILDPDIVIFGGGISQQPELYTIGIREIKRYFFSDSVRTKFVKNGLGDSSGVFGAALFSNELGF